MPFLAEISGEININHSDIALLKNSQNGKLKNKKGVHNSFTAFFKRLFGREHIGIVNVDMGDEIKTYRVSEKRFNKIAAKANGILMPNQQGPAGQGRIVTHLEKGLSNPSRTSCWINSAVVSFYPLRHLIEDIDDPIFKEMLEVYQNPSRNKEELAKKIKLAMNNKSRDRGDADIAYAFLIDRLIELKPDTASLFKATFEGFNCQCPRPQREIKRGANLTPSYNFTKGNIHTFSEFIPSFLERCCYSCKEEGPLPPKHPKYMKVSIPFFNHNPEIALDKTEFEWNGQRFRVLAIIETTGSHAICNVRSESGKWYKYDDGKTVKEIDPTVGHKKYTGFLIENLSV